MLATKMNEKINIPFVKEEKEQKFFEEMMDVVTDLLEGVFKDKYCLLRQKEDKRQIEELLVKVVTTDLLSLEPA